MKSERYDPSKTTDARILIIRTIFLMLNFKVPQKAFLTMVAI
jgi:hypothetical protein